MKLLLAALALSVGLRAGQATLGLPDLVRTALERNLDLQTVRLAVEAARGDVEAAQGLFDPQAHLAYEWNRNQENWTLPNGVGVQGDLGAGVPFFPVPGNSVFNFDALNALPKFEDSGTWGYDDRRAEILGKTPWSTEYHFSWESQRNDDTTRRIQPYPELWNSTLEAGFRQPLLRGRGPAIASAPVRRAGITLSAAQARALEEADQVAAAVERAYALYELACADERIAGISQRALATLQKNQEQNQLGLLSGIDLVAAERRHVDRQASLVAARQVRKDAQDALLALAYGAGAPAALAAGETPSPEAGPGLTEIPDLPALESCEARALERRKVLQAAHQDLEALQLDARLARDTLRPALDLTGSYRLQGLNNKSDGLTASSQAYAAGVRGWTVGLELTVPLPGRAARGAVRRAEANVREQELALQGMEVQVRTQVRSAYRAVQDTRVRLGMEGKVRELAEAHFTGETERFRLGLTTFFTLQQVEEEMDQADLIEAWARYDLEVAVSAIRQAMGESAETYLH